MLASSCEFSYRNSIFKHEFKNRAVITSVVFRLSKFPEFNLDYGQVEEKSKRKGRGKSYKHQGNHYRNSFFKTSRCKRDWKCRKFFLKIHSLQTAIAEQIQKQFENVSVYSAEDGKVKLAAGWLIENTGWKGVREGDVGVHEKQALVLVNHGNATGKQIFNFSKK